MEHNLSNSLLKSPPLNKISLVLAVVAMAIAIISLFFTSARAARELPALTPNASDAPRCTNCAEIEQFGLKSYKICPPNEHCVYAVSVLAKYNSTKITEMSKIYIGKGDASIRLINNMLYTPNDEPYTLRIIGPNCRFVLSKLTQMTENYRWEPNGAQLLSVVAETNSGEAWEIVMKIEYIPEIQALTRFNLHEISGIQTLPNEEN
jgi:hypothetical protein